LRQRSREAEDQHDEDLDEHLPDDEMHSVQSESAFLSMGNGSMTDAGHMPRPKTDEPNTIHSNPSESGSRLGLSSDRPLAKAGASIGSFGVGTEALPKRMHRDWSHLEHPDPFAGFETFRLADADSPSSIIAASAAGHEL